jgi:hypothetical protein
MNINEDWKIENNKYQCPECKKKLSKAGICSHIWRTHTEKGKRFKPAGCKKSWNKGLTKETDLRIKKMAEKISKIQSNNSSFRGKQHSIESRLKMSLSKKLLYKNGFECICGRSKKYEYISQIAGKINVDGKWELAVCRYLDSIKVTWIRNTKRFPYIHLNGKESTYCPDFYVNDWDIFIEVKGYETDLDKCKWNQFPNKLEVWKSKELIEKNIISRTGKIIN